MKFIYCNHEVEQISEKDGYSYVCNGTIYRTAHDLDKAINPELKAYLLQISRKRKKRPRKSKKA